MYRIYIKSKWTVPFIIKINRIPQSLGGRPALNSTPIKSKWTVLFIIQINRIPQSLGGRTALNSKPGGIPVGCGLAGENKTKCGTCQEPAN